MLLCSPDSCLNELFSNILLLRTYLFQNCIFKNFGELNYLNPLCKTITKQTNTYALQHFKLFYWISEACLTLVFTSQYVIRQLPAYIAAYFANKKFAQKRGKKLKGKSLKPNISLNCIGE